MRRTTWCALLLLLTACDAGSGNEPGRTPAAPPKATSPSSVAPTATASPKSARLRVRTAVRTVEHLAGSIGPRHATSPASERATRWTARQLRGLGYDVHRQTFAVPGGSSWGVPVPAGRSANLVATRDHRPDGQHLVVGAHLDTVPQAPGAEDNASGVGVLLALAEAVAATSTRLPVVFVAFGAEEPRGPTDLDHHYGSRHYVASLPAARRQSLRGMVSLDRVGVGDVLPICGAVAGRDRLENELLRAARRANVDAVSCDQNRSSDHWSFAREGLPGVRLGSTPYAGYHNAGDVPAVVNRAQLARAARTVLSWLSAS